MNESTKTLAQLKKASKLVRLAFRKNGPKSFKRGQGALLNALVETGHRLGLTILAEGVEEDYQIETLQKLHCDVLQGFRFCVPLPAAEAGRRILEQAQPGACSDSQEG